MFSTLHRCKTSNSAETGHYFTKLATQQMRKDKSEFRTKVGMSIKGKIMNKLLLII